MCGGVGVWGCGRFSRRFRGVFFSAFLLSLPPASLSLSVCQSVPPPSLLLTSSLSLSLSMYFLSHSYTYIQCIYLSTYLWMNACMCEWMDGCMCTRLHVHTHVHTLACAHGCMTGGRHANAHVGNRLCLGSRRQDRFHDWSLFHVSLS